MVHTYLNASQHHAKRVLNEWGQQIAPENVMHFYFPKESKIKLPSNLLSR